MQRQCGTNINRAMPANRGGSLKTDEVYALNRVLLYMNGIIQETDIMDAQSCRRSDAHRDGFVPAMPVWHAEPKKPSWY